MLPFFSAMSAEAHAADSLHVVARGLGSHRAAAQFIASAVDGQSLVLGLNVTRAFATGVLWPTLQGEANKGGIKSTNGLLLLPRFLNSDFSARDRACVYRGSGFIVVTAAILVHDLLHDTLPASRVSGVVIFAADAVKEKSNEHFALSLLRARNAGVFVKAFSDNAPALARGFHTAEKTMRMMYMTRLVLWPRFHQAVRKALSAHQPDLVDLAVQPSPRFNAMVAAFRDTVFAVLTDLKKVTSALDMSELYRSDGPNTDSSSRKKLVYNFDDVSRRQIQADHRHSGTRSRRVRALLADLTTLRSLLRDAFELNAVHFYQRVVTVRHAAHRGHTWLVRREAQPAVLLARSRVWVVRRRSSSTSSAAASASASVPSAGVAVGSGGDGGNSVITIDDDDDGQNKVGPATSSRTASENNQNNAETAGVRLSEDAADLVREPGTQVVTVPVLEPCPKWTVLREILAEIQADVATAGAAADVGRVLIVVRDPRTVDELSAVLRCGDGDRVHMQTLFQETFPSVAQRACASQTANDGNGNEMLQTTMTQVGLSEDERRRRALDKKRREEEKKNRQAQQQNQQAQQQQQNRQRQSSRSKKRTANANIHKEAQAQNRLLQQHMDQDHVKATLDTHFREVNSVASTELNIVLRCMDWVDIQGRGHRLLDEYRPAFVVLYDADLAFVRQVEVYKASHPGRPVRLYLLSFDESAEEARFRYASQREKDAFKTLIRERATMSAIVLDDGIAEKGDNKKAGDTTNDTDLEQLQFTQQMLTANAASSSWSKRRGLGDDYDSRRKGVMKQGPAMLGHAVDKGVASVGGGRIIVDTRELRSSLPMLLHQAGLTIVPVTLEVADFVLSTEIGIERKSVPDLHGSFGSGRLFNQADALCRHYKHPCLLIELDANKPLSLAACSAGGGGGGWGGGWGGGDGIPSELLATSILSKLVLLVQQFPMLCLLWAKGPHDAAGLFARLKNNHDEPDLDKAAAIGVDSSQTEDKDFHAGPKALLRSLPGIDSQNIMRVMRSVRNVSTLMTMSKDEMTDVLGSAAKAAKLYDFVNEKPSEALAAL